MKRPVILYYLIICFSLFGSSLATGQEKPIIKFGVIADIQYSDDDAKGTRFYRNSLNKLEASINDINTELVDFSVILGEQLVVLRLNSHRFLNSLPCFCFLLFHNITRYKK